MDWISNHWGAAMGLGGFGTVLFALRRFLPTCWELVTNAATAPYWRGQAKAMEALLDRQTKRAEQDAEMQTTRYARLYEAYQALLKSIDTPAPSPGSCDAPSDSKANPSTKTPS